MRIKVGEIGSYDAKVFLDGEERTHVIEANEEGRYIIRHRTDEHGRPILDAARENILTEKMRGDVRIDLAPRHEWIRKCSEQGGT